MKADKSGVPMTCPHIDSAIDYIESLSMDNYDREILIDLLEGLRKTNMELREKINELIDCN